MTNAKDALWSMKLQILTELPEGITGLAAHQLCQILDGPTLIHLRGKCEPPLFLCVLLHGNEIGGWDGAQNVRIIPQDCLCYLMERVENGV